MKCNKSTGKKFSRLIQTILKLPKNEFPSFKSIPDNFSYLNPVVNQITHRQNIYTGSCHRSNGFSYSQFQSQLVKFIFTSVTWLLGRAVGNNEFACCFTRNSRSFFKTVWNQPSLAKRCYGHFKLLSVQWSGMLTINHLTAI